MNAGNRSLRGFVSLSYEGTVRTYRVMILACALCKVIR